MTASNKTIKMFSNYNSEKFKERIDSVIKNTQKQMTEESLLFEKENNQVFRMVNKRIKKSVENSA